MRIKSLIIKTMFDKVRYLLCIKALKMYLVNNKKPLQNVETFYLKYFRLPSKVSERFV